MSTSSPQPRRRESRWVMAVGALIALAGVIFGALRPGTEKPPETVQGSILRSQIVPGYGGRQALRDQTVGVNLTILYTVDGKQGTFSDTVSAGAGVARQIYAAGTPITVYIGRDKYGTYATLNGPGAPRSVLWLTVVLFGAAWVVLGWFIGRPVRGKKASVRP